MSAERRYVLENLLSNDEQETLWLSGAGLNDREIAFKLTFHRKTIRTRLWKARNKLRKMEILQLDSKKRKHFGMGSNQLSIYSAGLTAEHGLIRPLPEKSRLLVRAAKIQLFGTD